MKATKNLNEYIEEGKHYIKEINKCICNEKEGNKYILKCKIHERGEKDYSYISGKDFILNEPNKKLWLTDSSKVDVEKSIVDFEDKIVSLKNNEAEIIDISELNLALYFNAEGETLFEYNDMIKIREIKSVEELIREICYNYHFYDNKPDTAEEIMEIIEKSNKETISRNPLYRYAINSGNGLLGLEIKLYYNLADENDCRIISGYYGERVLPPLPEQFDEYFAVDPDSVDFELLGRSGYKILHRPYFAMMNCTHDKIQLNPHTKQGIDAAEKDAEGITFEEYLEMFDFEDNFRSISDD